MEGGINYARGGGRQGAWGKITIRKSRERRFALVDRYASKNERNPLDYLGRRANDVKKKC